MTREDIIRMAREAGFDAHDMSADFTCNLKDIERFAVLVAERERDECAKVCEAQEHRVIQRHPARIEFDPDSMVARKCAAAIRARGEQK